jgi:hypothetical protein
LCWGAPGGQTPPPPFVQNAGRAQRATGELVGKLLTAAVLDRFREDLNR